MPVFWQYVIAALVVCGLIAVGVGRERGRPMQDSFMYGAVLGPVGILLVAMLPVPAPKGMRSVKCATCNAVQNVASGQAGWECWQCHKVTGLAL